jgi:hypothetical protein
MSGRLFFVSFLISLPMQGRSSKAAGQAVIVESVMEAPVGQDPLTDV